MSKTVLITGASSGIGRTTAQYLHDRGYEVYGTSRNPAGDYDFSMVTLDVTDPDSVNSCVEQVISEAGKLDVLVNNAGFGMIGGLAEATVEDMQDQFNANLFGVHRMVRAVLPQFRKQHQGMILNLGSFGGRLAIPYQTLYSASKAAVAMYSDGLRMELMRDNIVVSCIEPGDTRTEFDTRRREVSEYSGGEVPERAINIMREAEANGANPLKIAKLIHKLVRKERAKPRYTTGPDATIIGVLQRFIPFTLQERGLMINYKVPRK